MLLELAAAFSACVGAFVVFKMLTGKKTLGHILREMYYDAMYQDIGFWAMVDDRIRRSKNVLNDTSDRSGQIAVLTGGARGIGKYVVKGLVERGMRVVIGVRNPEAGRKVAEEFQEAGLSGSVDVKKLDVASMRSVEEFAKEVSAEYPKIHLLVNNAGIMFGDYKVTEDGFESQLATNYLGHFLLTHYLTGNLKAAGESATTYSRVVNVTSCAHKAGQIYYDDINMKTEYITAAAYSQSKVAQILSSRHMNHLFKRQGANVRCYSVHPGVVDTDLFQGTALKQHAHWIMRAFFKTAEQGAVSVLHTCLSPKLEQLGGAYVSNCSVAKDSAYSRKDEHQERLFKLTCEMLKVKTFGVV